MPFCSSKPTEPNLKLITNSVKLLLCKPLLPLKEDHKRKVTLNG